MFLRHLWIKSILLKTLNKVSAVPMTPLNTGRHLQSGESGDSITSGEPRGKLTPKCVLFLYCMPNPGLLPAPLMASLCPDPDANHSPAFLAKNKVCSFPDLPGNYQEA